MFRLNEVIEPLPPVICGTFASARRPKRPWVDPLEGQRGDDRPADRVGEEGVDEHLHLAAPVASVEDEQLRGHVDGLLFGESDLCGRLAGPDQRRLASPHRRLRVGRLQLSGPADREALRTHDRVLVDFERDLAHGRRVGPVRLLHATRGRHAQRLERLLRQCLRRESAAGGHFQFSDPDGDRSFAVRRSGGTDHSHPDRRDDHGHQRKDGHCASAHLSTSLFDATLKRAS
jgi:hypothetical protein